MGCQKEAHLQLPATMIFRFLTAPWDENAFLALAFACVPFLLVTEKRQAE